MFNLLNVVSLSSATFLLTRASTRLKSREEDVTWSSNTCFRANKTMTFRSGIPGDQWVASCRAAELGVGRGPTESRCQGSKHLALRTSHFASLHSPTQDAHAATSLSLCRQVGVTAPLGFWDPANLCKGLEPQAATAVRCFEFFM